MRVCARVGEELNIIRKHDNHTEQETKQTQLHDKPLVDDRSNSDADEELAGLTKLVEASANSMQQKRKLEPITAREAAALLGYIDSIEMTIAKRTRSVTDREDRDVDYDKDKLQTGLIKLLKIAATPSAKEAERESSSE